MVVEDGDRCSVADVGDQGAGVAAADSDADRVDGSVFPNPAALLRLAGSVLIETHDEWQVSDRRYLSEGSMALIDQPDPAEEVVASTALIAS